VQTPPFLTLDSVIKWTKSGHSGATVQLEVLSGGVVPIDFSFTLGQPSTLPSIGYTTVSVYIYRIAYK
jgi:hypothetical protein